MLCVGQPKAWWRATMLASSTFSASRCQKLIESIIRARPLTRPSAGVSARSSRPQERSHGCVQRGRQPLRSPACPRGSSVDTVQAALQEVKGVTQVTTFPWRKKIKVSAGKAHTHSHIRMSPAKSDAVTPFHWMRILPRGPSNSIRQSGAPIPWGITSKNAVGVVGCGLGLAASAIRLSLRYSRRKTLAVRKNAVLAGHCRRRRP
jgi:hypothetical protein